MVILLSPAFSSQAGRRDGKVTIMTQSLYSPEFERDSCGFGLIAQLDNQASHYIVATAISSLARLTHRGAVAADGKTGDG
ncbi:MAG: hypothetical protein ACYCSH_12845, partial [Acidithiobacillus sp.]